MNPEDSESSPTIPPAVAPRPVLAYAPPLPPGRRWFRSSAWSVIALAVSLFYCVLGIAPALIGVYGHDVAESMLPQLLATAPVGVIAVTLAVLGHFAPDGRRLAGPAMWICGITPGLIAISTLLASVPDLRPTLVARVALVVAIDATVLWALNGRILREKQHELIT